AQIPNDLDDKSRALIGVGGGQNYATPTPEVRNQFTADDIRRDATFVEAYRKASPTDSTYYTTVALKFRGFVDGGVRRYLDDIVLYRYADVLLVIAEAKN